MSIQLLSDEIVNHVVHSRKSLVYYRIMEQVLPSRATGGESRNMSLTSCRLSGSALSLLKDAHRLGCVRRGNRTRSLFSLQHPRAVLLTFTREDFNGERAYMKHIYEVSIKQTGSAMGRIITVPYRQN